MSAISAKFWPIADIPVGANIRQLIYRSGPRTNTQRCEFLPLYSTDLQLRGREVGPDLKLDEEKLDCCLESPNLQLSSNVNGSSPLTDIKTYWQMWQEDDTEATGMPWMWKAVEMWVIFSETNAISQSNVYRHIAAVQGEISLTVACFARSLCRSKILLVTWALIREKKMGIRTHEKNHKCWFIIILDIKRGEMPPKLATNLWVCLYKIHHKHCHCTL